MATVLVVDDDAGIRSYLTALIQGWGHQVISASNADDALGWLELGGIDIAFCDIVMPGYNGIWLIEQIVGSYPDTAVVIATGLDRMDPRLTLQPCVAGYITKPFEPERVARMIRRALRLPKLGHAVRTVDAFEGV